MAFNEEQHIQQLVTMYRAGFRQIVEILANMDAKKLASGSARYRKQILRNVAGILQDLDQNADNWIISAVGRAYSASLADTIVMLNKLGITSPVRSNFARVHQRAVDVIAQNMSGNLRNATQFVGRRVNDIFRQVALEQTGAKLVTGASWQEMKAKVIQEMLNKGQTGFVDKIGRQWRLDSYAEMVARTTTREAASVATINQCLEYGQDLVQISTHYPTCHLCAPLQGKVFSISGNDKRYPKLEDEYRPPIHPRCRHVLTPYVRELDPDAKKTERHSNTSLTEDPRTEDEKRAYKETQDAATIKRIRRRSREVLYTPSAPKIDKVKAAQELNKTYEKTGVKPTGRDAALLKEYEDWLKLGKIVDIDEENGIIKVQGRSLPLNAVPNMAVYLLDKDNKVKQIRFYDDDKNVKLDIDMTDHGHPKAHPIVPHAHDWKTENVLNRASY